MGVVTTTRYHPRSPGARLQALRRALWEEDRARENVTSYPRRLLRSAADLLSARDESWSALETATAARMEAERDLWEARAGHGLD